MVILENVVRLEKEIRFDNEKRNKNSEPCIKIASTFMIHCGQAAISIGLKLTSGQYGSTLHNGVVARGNWPPPLQVKYEGCQKDNLKHTDAEGALEG